MCFSKDDASHAVMKTSPRRALALLAFAAHCVVVVSSSGVGAGNKKQRPKLLEYNKRVPKKNMPVFEHKIP